ncbi:peptidyl-prolyl cis-trans isomerase sig-7 [Condylostylus longicornis]|uniref:peptidyl-prolyl cis-trans isomerase sig-7 n=1 Tax=Condylostylus longicornis TaxID=2530218 RepID=UPI00244DBD9A|nr:peptidyl-prolyl cis-trans isomerase sig-7 [Condylostylus longicornis]
MSVVIETTIGDITVDLFIEERFKACLNFLKLCKLKYYNYNLFHNIERNFIAQSGDPTGAGDGGESIWGVIEGRHKRFFEAENLPKIKHDISGLLSLVSIGKQMVSSQFFFTLGQDLISLDNMHCVIGEVVEGHDVLRKLNEAIVDEKFRPYQDIRITHTVILEDPFEDPRGLRVPSRSPSPSAERLKNGRIAADEDIDDTEGKTAQEIQEMLAEREAKARATILEIVGDLPDADIAPPENVLFVCKLNPVTTEDDLEIIFSRFGKVIGCEVIKDKISGDSLQYAFVEFEDKKACEAAYFKMDNVLIDDRRIHVDFSQSVAKVQWKGKGRGLIYKEGKEDRKLDFNNYKNIRKENKNFMTTSRTRKSRSPQYKINSNSKRRSRSESPSRSFGYKSGTSRNKYSDRRYERHRDRSPYRKSFQSSYHENKDGYEKVRNQRSDYSEKRYSRKSRSRSPISKSSFSSYSYHKLEFNKSCNRDSQKSENQDKNDDKKNSSTSNKKVRDEKRNSEKEKIYKRYEAENKKSSKSKKHKKEKKKHNRKKSSTESDSSSSSSSTSTPQKKRKHRRQKRSSS